MAVIRVFSPGDATRYRYSVQLGHQLGDEVHMFSFGVMSDAMTTVTFPADVDFIHFDYFAEKFGRNIRNQYTILVAYMVFCWITSRRAEGYDFEGRQWNPNWTDQLDFDL